MPKTGHRNRTRAWRMVCLCAAFVCALVLAAPALAYADIIYVSQTTGSDVTGTGSSAHPYKSVTRGLSEAVSGDTVRVAIGTYSATHTGETFPLWVPPGVTVQGCGTPYSTHVQGDGTTSVFRMHNSNSNTVLDGLLITNGGGTNGGGVRITGASSPGYGPVIKRCVISANTVSDGGGGISIDRGVASACAPSILFTYVIGNTAADGGGIDIDDATDFNLYGSAVLGNHADSGHGGGLRAYSCTYGNIEKCAFANNIAQDGGCTYFDSCTAIEQWDTQFIANAAGWGGGVFNTNTTSLWTKNCVFWLNEAEFGGAGYNTNSGNSAYVMCTIAQNQASDTAGGLRRVSGTLSVADSILWDNGGDDVEGVAPGDISVSYSCVQEAGVTGTGVIHTDPQFLYADDPYLLLQSTSPCIDTGNPTVSSGVDIEGIGRPKDGNGDGIARSDMGAFEYWLQVSRSFGDDRYRTAVNMWDRRFSYSHYAVIATGRDFPDALCASGLVGVYNCPILLTEPNYVPSQVIDALEDHDIYEVFIVGGPGVVSSAVVSQLEAMGIGVTRLYGDNRYETASAVADHIVTMTAIDRVLIARGDNFPDALALSPVAFRTQSPILLVEPDSVPTATRNALTDYAFDDGVIAGAESAVSEDVEGVIEYYLGPTNVTRLGGDNRYDTSAQIAAYAIAENWLTPNFFGIATGENFPDALAGGAVSGTQSGPLLLTGASSLHSSARTVMLANRDELREIRVFGGSGVVDGDVLDDCAELME